MCFPVFFCSIEPQDVQHMIFACRGVSVMQSLWPAVLGGTITTGPSGLQIRMKLRGGIRVNLHT